MMMVQTAGTCLACRVASQPRSWAGAERRRAAAAGRLPGRRRDVRRGAGAQPRERRGADHHGPAVPQVGRRAPPPPPLPPPPPPPPLLLLLLPLLLLLLLLLPPPPLLPPPLLLLMTGNWGLLSHPATCRAPVVCGASGRGKPASKPSECSEPGEPGEPSRPNERSGPSNQAWRVAVMPQPKNAWPLDASRAVWSCFCSRGSCCRCPCTSSLAKEPCSSRTILAAASIIQARLPCPLPRRRLLGAPRHTAAVPGACRCAAAPVAPASARRPTSDARPAPAPRPTRPAARLPQQLHVPGRRAGAAGRLRQRVCRVREGVPDGPAGAGVQAQLR
jgi:hypothetical protein